MSAVMGPAPWSEGYRSVSKKRAKEAGYEWDLSSGWHAKRNSDWYKDPKHTEMKEITLATGRKVKVPIGDFTDYLNYSAEHGKNIIDDEDSANTEIADYIEYAFNRTKSGNKPKVWHTKGVGHIASLDYSTRKQLLKVEFANNGAVVVYFRVPAAVYGELSHLADSNLVRMDANGIERHLLGIRFWDLVRIRGNLYGSKYKFKYLADGTSYGNAPGRPETRRMYASGYDKNTGEAIYKKEKKAKVSKEEYNEELEQMYQDYLEDSKELGGRATIPEMNEIFNKHIQRFADQKTKQKYIDEFKSKKTQEDLERFMIKLGIL